MLPGGLELYIPSRSLLVFHCICKSARELDPTITRGATKRSCVSKAWRTIGLTHEKQSRLYLNWIKFTEESANCKEDDPQRPPNIFLVLLIAVVRGLLVDLSSTFFVDMREQVDYDWVFAQLSASQLKEVQLTRDQTTSSSTKHSFHRIKNDWI